MGDSVAVDGVCLTVVEVTRATLAFDVVPETTLALDARGAWPRARRSTSSLPCAPGIRSVVTSCKATSTVSAASSVDAEGDGRRMWIETPADVLRYCVEKGSIAVSGVSLTVAELSDDAFAVALVPHTLETTTLGVARAG